MDDGHLTVPFDKNHVKGAPNVTPGGGELSQEEEAQLYDYYGMPYGESHSESGLPETGTGRTDRGVREGGSDDAMTRSEERLDVGTRDTEAGRVRLRKYVDTEHVQTELPVRRERAVLEREPVTDANAEGAMGGPDITESEHEVTLHEEKPVVGKHTEPVERVRLGTEQETGRESVQDEVRKERIESEGEGDE